MKTTDSTNVHAANNYTAYKSTHKGNTEKSRGSAIPGDPTDLLDLSVEDTADTFAKKARRNLGYEFAEIGYGFSVESEDDEKKQKSSGLEDKSRYLTKRLVASKTKMQVQDVMAEAYKELGEALKAAAGGDPEVIAIIKRLQKLIKRIHRKLRDLDKEAELGQKAKRAKEKELEQLAKQHEMELKRRLAERKKREKKYLQDPKEDDEKEKYQISIASIPKSELEALLRSMMPMAVAAIEAGTFSDASFGGGGIEGGDGGDSGGASVSVGGIEE